MKNSCDVLKTDGPFLELHSDFQEGMFYYSKTALHDIHLE